MSFSQSIGAVFTAKWSSRSVLRFEVIDENDISSDLIWALHVRSLLVITLSDVSGAQQPLPTFLTASILPAANLRNYPPQCAPFTGRS